GISYAKNGNKVRASEDYRKALQLDPNHPQARREFEGIFVQRSHPKSPHPPIVCAPRPQIRRSRASSDAAVLRGAEIPALPRTFRVVPVFDPCAAARWATRLLHLRSERRD